LGKRGKRVWPPGKKNTHEPIQEVAGKMAGKTCPPEAGKTEGWGIPREPDGNRVKKTFEKTYHVFLKQNPIQ